MYDENSTTFKIINYYVDNLKKYYKLDNNDNKIKGRLIKYEELIDLGCPSSGDGKCTNEKNNKWLFRNYTIWTGTASNPYNIWSLSLFGEIFNHNFFTKMSIRPVIEVDKSLLKIS